MSDKIRYSNLPSKLPLPASACFGRWPFTKASESMSVYRGVLYFSCVALTELHLGTRSGPSTLVAMDSGQNT